MRISHSKIDKYNLCPRLYKYHYIDGYRDPTLSSALFMGLGIGETWQQMILNKKEDLTDEEKKIKDIDPYKFFDEHCFDTVDINGVKYKLDKCEHARYFKSDWDEEILNDEDWDNLEYYRKEVDVKPFEELWYQLWDKSNKKDLTTNEYKFVNYACYLSLKTKAYLMIKEFADKILPRIGKVYHIEKQISIENGDGDEIIGFLDVDCEFLCEDDVWRRTIIDNKTSSAKYKADSLNTKPQLAIYEYAEEVGHQGYIIGLKQIKIPKRGDRKGETHAEIQVLDGSITEERQEEVIADIDATLQKIKSGDFPKDLTSGCRVFGRLCPFFSMCRQGASDKYLFKKDRKVETITDNDWDKKVGW